MAMDSLLVLDFTLVILNEEKGSIYGMFGSSSIHRLVETGRGRTGLNRSENSITLNT